MILKFVETIGDKTIDVFASFYQAFTFAVFCFFHMMSPQSYNETMQKALVHQIYHTSITIIPIFSLIALVFGSIIIGIVISLATNFNLQVGIGSIIVNFVVNEFSPIFTALFISLRSGTLISKKLALIDITNEVDLIDNTILPRILSGILSTVTLSILFATIMIMSGYVSVYFFIGMDFHTYEQLLYGALSLDNIFIFFFKTISFGFIVMFIPIYNGISVSKNKLTKRISLIDTLIKLFFAIFFVEIFALLFVSLLEM